MLVEGRGGRSLGPTNKNKAEKEEKQRNPSCQGENIPIPFLSHTRTRLSRWCRLLLSSATTTGTGKEEKRKGLSITNRGGPPATKLKYDGYTLARAGRQDGRLVGACVLGVFPHGLPIQIGGASSGNDQEAPALFGFLGRCPAVHLLLSL